MSTKIEAGPSAPARSPSSTRHIEGQFVTFEMRAPQLDNDIVAIAPSLLRTETVAFGGSLAKSPLVHSSNSASVGRCPAALTGRSAS
jgi:hypothetical protein